MDKNFDNTKEFYTEQNEKLIELINRVKKSNDDEAFDMIKSKMEKYITSVTNKFFISGCTNDDIKQECLIALRFKSINDYDEKKGPFVRFAKLCIRRHIITELKACKKKRSLVLNKALSLDESLNDDDDGESSYSLMDIVVDEPSNDHFKKVNIRERGRYLYNILSRKLTLLEYKILVYYLKGYNYTEIANILKFENLLEYEDDEELDKKAIDNGLCRIKKKAKELKIEMNSSGKIQEDMFMDLTKEI